MYQKKKEKIPYVENHSLLSHIFYHCILKILDIQKIYLLLCRMNPERLP